MFTARNNMCRVPFLGKFLWCTGSGAFYVSCTFVWDKQKGPGTVFSMSKTPFIIITIIIIISSTRSGDLWEMACRNITAKRVYPSLM